MTVHATRLEPSPAGRGLTLLGGAGMWLAAGVVSVVAVALLTAVLVVAGLVGAAVLAVVGRVPSARRPKADDSDLIEAHHVGGHSWVAYGLEGR